MWRRFHFQSRAIDAMTINSSPGSPYGEQADSSKNMVANDKVILLATGAFFGLMFLLFGIQIYVRCIWRRIETEAMGLAEDSEEMTRTENYIREVGTGRRNWRRRLDHYLDERNDSSSPAQQINSIGLDKSVLELLPTFIFSEGAASRDEIVCAVCLEEFVDGESGRVIPRCSHCFHVQCIDMWFLSHSSCPLCRCEVTLPSPETVSSTLLPNNQNCPDLSPDRSEQQQQEAQPSATPSLECPPVSSSAPDAESASINSNNALYLERGSSLSRRAAAIALEISDYECINVTEEDPSMSAVGAPRRLQENTTTVASSASIGSPRHARTRSYLAVEIIAEYQLDATGAMSRIDSSSIQEVRLQPA